MASELGWDPAIWTRLSGELGWTALVIPEIHGGLGLGDIELAVLMEEMGRAVLCAPYLSTVCLAAQALVLGGTEEQKSAYLPLIASGHTAAALAVQERGGGWAPSPMETTARADGDTVILDGEKPFVLDGGSAELLLVAARDAVSQEVDLWIVPGDAKGLQRTALPTLDPTRRQATVRLDGVCVPASARLAGTLTGWPLIERVVQRATIALSAEQVGGAERCLDMAVQYAKVREQFGRPIGSFQAVQHMCADMLVLVESARSASLYAAWCAATGDARLQAATHLAAATCSEAFFRCASQNIQIHGGIGFTWEHDAHLHFKRASASRMLFGEPNAHREAIAREVLG